MKKLLLTGLALSLLALTTPAKADSWSWEEWYEMENNIGINVIPGVNYSIPLQQGVSAGVGQFNFGAQVMWKPYYVMNNRLGFSVGAFLGTTGMQGINSMTISIPLVARYYFIKRGGFQPYAGIGFGVDLVTASSSIGGAAGASSSTTVLSGIGRVGTDLMFSPNIGANLNVDLNAAFVGGVNLSIAPGVGLRILF